MPKDTEPKLFFSDELVWAVSKPESNAQAGSYELSEATYQGLIAEVAFARDRLQKTLDFMQALPAREEKNLFDQGGRLTGLGLLADHFNLIKARRIITPEWFPGGWTMEKSPDLKKFSKANVDMLYNTVSGVLTTTLEGLRAPLLFRGKSIKDAHINSSGYIVRERDFPEEAAGGKGKLPKLRNDNIFMTQGRQLTTNIHLDYREIDEMLPSKMLGLLNATDTCCSWTIIHEATHKFARTRDFGAAGYKFDGCRQLHWQDAVRSAKHYETFAGLQWDAIAWKPCGLTFSARNIDFYGLP